MSFSRDAGVALFFLLSSVAGMNACASSSAPGVQPVADQGEHIPWVEKSKKQKGAYMEQTVLPKMKPLMEAADPDEFADVECGTCHGPRAKDGDFEMPNEHLHKLDPTDSFKKHKEENPKLTEFMMKTVVPEMAALLGQSPYDPATETGFDCFNCHTNTD